MILSMEVINGLNINVANSKIDPSISARNLRVIFDNHMVLDKQVNCICMAS